MTDYEHALSGPLSALFTPYDGSGRIDLDRVDQLIEYQLALGVKGFFVAGSTGESLLLSSEERQLLVQHVVATVAGRAAVVAHVGHPSTSVAVDLARHAADSGADWIASVGPIYYGTTFEGTMRHYQAIATATDRPFMIYSLGQEIVPQRDRELFDIPNVQGMKYTGSNFYSVQQLARLVQRDIVWMSGFDEQFVAALLFGFHGGIGSTFNFAPEFYAQIYQAVRDNDAVGAAEIQRRINQVTELMTRHENRSYFKAVMRYVGIDCGPYRPPYRPLTEEEYTTFRQQLDALGVLTPNHASTVLG